MGKLDPLLREQIKKETGKDVDPPITVEFYSKPTSSDISTLQNIGLQITSVSSILPYVSGGALPDQITQIEKMSSVKKIWYNAPVGMLVEWDHRLLKGLEQVSGINQRQIKVIVHEVAEGVGIDLEKMQKEATNEKRY